MGFTSTLASIAALATIATAAVTGRDNVVLYWGQGGGQQRLSHYCEEGSANIINIGFMDLFPAQANGYGGTNFGNACWSNSYVDPNTGIRPYVYDAPGWMGVDDDSKNQLLNSCPQLAGDIQYCQSKGVKILLSLGGATNGYQLDSQGVMLFARHLWRSFGPKAQNHPAGYPRPFDPLPPPFTGQPEGSTTVDGFDFDIEHASLDGDAGYVILINELRKLMDNANAAGDSRNYIISGTPQCIPETDPMRLMINQAKFDLINIQFYNTDRCSARNWVSKNPGTSETIKEKDASAWTFDAWATALATGASKDAKITVGLMGSTLASSPSYASHYLNTNDMKSIIDGYYCRAKFAGIMLWDATYADDNVINGLPYQKHVRDKLTAMKPCTGDPRKVSPDGTCGNSYTCEKSNFGSCCSQWGSCGDAAEHCDAGCRPSHGLCWPFPVTITSTSSASSTSTSTSSTSSETSTTSEISTTSESSTSTSTTSTTSETTSSETTTSETTSSETTTSETTTSETTTSETTSATSTSSETTSLETTSSTSTIETSTSETTSSTSTSTPTPTPTPLPGGLITSPDGTCGNKYSCQNYGPLNYSCCNQWGSCGSTPYDCGAGCKVGYGDCDPPASTTSTPTPSATPLPGGLITSPDGTCGNKYSCQNYPSLTGYSCCNQWGSCGSSPSDCGTGCKVGYGHCDPQPTPTPTPLPGGLITSPDGTCGNKYSCQNYGTLGYSCCNQWGSCGSSASDCGTGCKVGYGHCDPQPTPTPTPLPGGLITSPDGTCGNKYSCQNFGSLSYSCCNQWGSCGSSASDCGTGCKKGYGFCYPTVAPPAKAGLISSPNGTCGNLYTCTGSALQKSAGYACCNRWGSCSTNVDECTNGCVKGYGGCY